jgi:adenylate kinase
MIRLVMLGGPGSGKGTQARKLSQDLKIPVISTGEILKRRSPIRLLWGMKHKSMYTEEI